MNNNLSNPIVDIKNKDTNLVNLVYYKVPESDEIRKRQNEEALRKKYNIPKEKKGELL